MKFTRIFATAALVSVFSMAAAVAQTTNPDVPTPPQLRDQLNQRAEAIAADAISVGTLITYDELYSVTDEHGGYSAFVATAGMDSEQLAYMLARLQEAGWQTKPGVIGRNGWLIQPADNWSTSPRGNEVGEISWKKAHPDHIPSVATVLQYQTNGLAAVVDYNLLQNNFGCAATPYNSTIEVQHNFLAAVGNIQAVLAHKGWQTKLISLSKDQDGHDRISLCISKAN